MSFFGKKFKKVNFEHVTEYLENSEFSEKLQALLPLAESVSSFVENEDGSIQYVVESADEEVIFTHKIVPGEDVKLTTPNGDVIVVHFTLEGDVLKGTVTLSEELSLHMDRYFEENGFRLELYASIIEAKGIINYETV